MRAMLLLFAAVFVSVDCAFGQAAPLVKLGTITSNAAFVITKATVLANTTLVPETAGCVVTGFKFSVFPVGHNFIGPYTYQGASLPAEAKEIIKNQDAGGSIYIENIQLKCGADVKVATPIAFKYK